jgi:hypothetical protein
VKSCSSALERRATRVMVQRRQEDADNSKVPGPTTNNTFCVIGTTNALDFCESHSRHESPDLYDEGMSMEPTQEPRTQHHRPSLKVNNVLRVHLDVCSHHVKHHATESQQCIRSRSTSTSLTQKLSRLCLEGQVEKTLQSEACIVERPGNRS